MAKTKRKRIVKPTTEKQEVEGLDLSFEDAMKVLAKQPDNVKTNRGINNLNLSRMIELEVPVEYTDSLKEGLPSLRDYNDGCYVKSFTYKDTKYEAYFYKVIDHYNNYIWEYNPFKVTKTN